MTSNGPTSAYSQSIDLSTLLQKPTTQSSVGSSSAAPGAQFNQQATETLKAVVGIGQSASTASASNPPKDNMYPSYAQASAFTSIKQGQQGQKPAGQQAVGARPSASTGQSRIPNATSNSMAPAVEMPGDSLGRLDVQFGGLDLQFGGTGSSTANSDNISGFEFGAAPTASEVEKSSGKSKAGGVEASFAPSAKEVNKSLSNAVLTSGGGQGKMPPTASAVASVSSSNDSFSKAPSASASASTASNSVPMVPVAPGSTGSSGNFNKAGNSASGSASGSDLSYPGYNNYKSYNTNYQQYQYPNNQFSASQQGSSNSSQYKTGGQYDKYDPQMNNPAAAVLGLANTSTTNALSGKVSATTASKSKFEFVFVSLYF